MPKATLHFDLNDPDDQDKFKVTSKAMEWYLVCVNFDNELRDLLKYHNAGKEVDDIRTRFHKLMHDYGVSLEDMV